MKNAILAKIDFEGSTETVSVFYKKLMLGDPRIVDVRLHHRSIFKTVRHDNLMMNRLRAEVMNVLGRRSFADYQQDMMSQLAGFRRKSQNMNV